ncbi:MAG: Ig-like domain-containing protein [Anaerolineae bacterium]
MPKRAGYTFTPSSITVKADGTDKADLVFTATPVNVNAPTAATHALVGYVRDEGGNGVPGAMIYYQNGADKIYLGTSGPSGLYIVQGVPAGTSYSFVGAYHLGYDFSFGYTLSNITSDVTDLVITGTQIADFMVGQAQLQGHYDAPNDQWWFGYPLTVELFEPGGTTPVATQEVKIDSWGYFVVPGIAPGVYDVRIKNHHSLSQKKLNVTVNAHQLVRFTILPEGDVNDDDGIWYEDFSALQNAYATCVGDANFNPLADIDDSGCVWGYDASLLTTNFGIGGQTASTSVTTKSTPALDSVTLRSRLGVYSDTAHQANVPASVHGRFLLTSAAAQNLAVGEIFTVTVGVRSPDRGLDSVTAFLNFDPNYLEVVDADGASTDRVVVASTLPLVIVNQVDNELGHIDLVVNRTLGSVPVTGTFDLATLRFRLKQRTSGTLITFDNTDSVLALSDIDLEGYGYLKRDANTPLPTVTASSANHAPTVIADQYLGKKNTVLHVSAPGATANDIDIDGDPFWLEWYIPPSHGDLTLYNDGSFVYTPTLNFVGTDTFEYQGYDGLDLSEWTTVTIQVVNPEAYIYLPLVLR